MLLFVITKLNKKYEIFSKSKFSNVKFKEKRMFLKMLLIIELFNEFPPFFSLSNKNSIE